MSGSRQEFEHYISLGINCEIDWQLREQMGQRESGFFASAIMPLKALLSILSSDFAGICQAENLRYKGVSTLVHDLAHGYSFHWVGPNIEHVNDPDAEGFVRNAGRLHYLAAKFRKTVASGKPIAFLCTCREEPPYEILAQVAELLEHRYGCKDFKLIALQTIDRFEPPWEHPRLVNRYFKRLAPWSDVSDVSVECWNAVFEEFPLRARSGI